MCVPKGTAWMLLLLERHVITLSSVIDQVIEENVKDGEVGTSRLDVLNSSALAAHPI